LLLKNLILPLTASPLIIMRVPWLRDKAFGTFTLHTLGIPDFRGYFLKISYQVLNNIVNTYTEIGFSL